MRASYEVFPGVKPFVEVGADTRKHELQFDRDGYQRDSQAFTPKVGTTFEITRKLTGEISVGYLMRHYQDPDLQDLRGVIFDASLKWEATGLTTATLTGNLARRGNRGGRLVRRAAARRRRAGRSCVAALADLDGAGRAIGFDEYVSDSDRAAASEDKRMSLGSALTYKFNRDLSLKGEYRYDQLHSNAAGVELQRQRLPGRVEVAALTRHRPVRDLAGGRDDGHAEGEPKVRRWTGQRWALDNVLRSVGIDWDQPRSFYLNAACGIEGGADFAAIRERVKKYADIEPAFANTARRREAKARAAEEDGSPVTARDNYFMAAIHWGSAQWSHYDNDATNLAYNKSKRDCYTRYARAGRSQDRAGDDPVQGQGAAGLVPPAAELHRAAAFRW